MIVTQSNVRFNEKYCVLVRFLHCIFGELIVAFNVTVDCVVHVFRVVVCVMLSHNK